MPSSEIPVLDLAMADYAAAGFAAEFGRAYRETGFATLINHGIDPDLSRAVFDANRQFHALPLARKMMIELDANHRGYIPINTSTDVNSKLAVVKKPNQSESFIMMREDSAALPGVFLSGPNQWPDLPGFRETLETYHHAMLALGQRLIRIALTAAGVAARGFPRWFERPTTWLRLLHYPPRPEQAAPDLYGSAPHTDFGCLTILQQDNVGGLEVKTVAGDWIPVPFIPGALVVNVGDMLHRMTNGILRSTPHRVINASGRERYSVPFFFDPDVNVDVIPLPGTGEARFPPIRFSQFLRDELGAAYSRHQTPANQSEGKHSG